MSATFNDFKTTYLPGRINVLQDELANCNQSNYDTLYGMLYTIVNDTYSDYKATLVSDPTGANAAQKATCEVFFKNAESFATMYRNKICDCTKYTEIINEISQIFYSIKSLL